MRIPKVFISEKDLDKKIEELLTKKVLTYNSKRDKAGLIFEVNIVKYGEEFVIEYPIDASKGFIKKELKIIQPKIRKNGLNDLVILAESISSYHNRSVSLSAMIKRKDGQNEGICTIPLDQHLSIDDFLKTIKTFYKDNMDSIKSVEVKYEPQ